MDPPDGNAQMSRTLDAKIEAKFVRLVMKEWEREIALRVEIKACKPSK